MKVLFVSNDPDAFKSHSAVRERLRAYADALVELHVLSTASESAGEVHEGALHLYPIHASQLLRIPALIRRARTLVREKGIEVVSAQDPFEYGLAAWWATWGTQARLHIQLHTDPFASDFVRTSFMNRFRVWLMSFVLLRARHIRVVSEHLKAELEHHYHLHVPITVLPIYADLTRVHTVVRTPEKGRLLWIGRFEREKDPMLALEALAAVRAAGVDAKLTMLGSGRLLKALAARTKVRGLTPFVELPGYADPLPYLARAELVLATSRYEGYGLAIVEALAAGVPVVSTDVGIAREAGAIIAPREGYPAALVQWFKNGPREGHLATHPYASFEEYVACYVADITATQGP